MSRNLFSQISLAKYSRELISPNLITPSKQKNEKKESMK